MAIAGFLVYTAFCAWVVLYDGAEVLEGWRAALVVDLWAGLLSAQHLRLYVAVSWVASLVGLLWRLAAG
ncbi:hypothetical protein [Lysobacter xanthus]